jgi:hypothetical protein
MPTTTCWHGTPTEYLELTLAVTSHCTCAFHTQSRQLSICAGHEMLYSDQRALDGLLFACRIASRLRNEEFYMRPVLTEVERVPELPSHPRSGAGHELAEL